MVTSIFTLTFTLTLTTILLSVYYFTTFKEEIKNENYYQYSISVALFLLLYISTFFLIYNIVDVYNSYNKYKIPQVDPVASLRRREDTFARTLARRAPDPDNVINPLFDRSPQFLTGPFGPNNPRANQIAYTFF
jgi:hypothetical protein